MGPADGLRQVSTGDASSVRGKAEHPGRSNVDHPRWADYANWIGETGPTPTDAGLRRRSEREETREHAGGGGGALEHVAVREPHDPPARKCQQPIAARIVLKGPIGVVIRATVGLHSQPPVGPREVDLETIAITHRNPEVHARQRQVSSAADCEEPFLE